MPRTEVSWKYINSITTKPLRACVRTYDGLEQKYYGSKQSIIQMQTTGATDEDKKRLAHIPSSERDTEQQSWRCDELKTGLKDADRLLCSGTVAAKLLNNLQNTSSVSLSDGRSVFQLKRGRCDGNTSAISVLCCGSDCLHLSLEGVVQTGKSPPKKKLWV